MKTRIKKAMMFLLTCTLLLAAVPIGVSAGAAAKFSDVKSGSWYEEFIDQIMWAQELMGANNIITGYPDGSFQPDGTLKRGEFLKMIVEAEEASETILLTTDHSQDGIHWAARYYTKAMGYNILVADVYTSSEPMFPCTYDALEQPITRYEMAVILNNFCLNICPSGKGYHRVVIVDAPEQHIPDYADIPVQYVTAVEQSYGKGMLTGDEYGAFNGGNTLTRAEAVVVIYRYLFTEGALQSWAKWPVAQTSNYLDPALSFANWLHNGHIDSWGNIDAEAKTKLFGSPYKSYFTSSYDAAPYMTTVSVPIWTMDKAGNRYSSTTSITVHVLVAEEVKSIFQMIYDDPEKFPIYGGWSAGGARFTDTLRHSWGCAIDINAFYNCECDFKGAGGSLRVTCGYGWWPIGHSDRTYAGSMTSQSAYSIGANPGEYGYSVVKAFATYGWGWGGRGYSSGKHDFMHFSVLPSGG